jgi:hypothetical protein
MNPVDDVSSKSSVLQYPRLRGMAEHRQILLFPHLFLPPLQRRLSTSLLSRFPLHETPHVDHNLALKLDCTAVRLAAVCVGKSKYPSEIPTSMCQMILRVQQIILQGRFFPTRGVDGVQRGSASSNISQNAACTAVEIEIKGACTRMQWCAALAGTFLAPEMARSCLSATSVSNSKLCQHGKSWAIRRGVFSQHIPKCLDCSGDQAYPLK